MIKPMGLFSDRTQLQSGSFANGLSIYPFKRFPLLKLFRLHFLFGTVWTYMIEMQFLEIVGLWHFLTAISRYILF